LKVPLTGVELEIFQQRQRLAWEKAVVAQATHVHNQQLLKADEVGDSSDSDPDAKDKEDVEHSKRNPRMEPSMRRSAQRPPSDFRTRRSLPRAQRVPLL
jgi:hypothetical protein